MLLVAKELLPMVLAAKELLPMVLAAAVVGDICYFRGFSHGMEKAMEEIQNVMNQFIEINLDLMKKHFGEEGEDEKDNV